MGLGQLQFRLDGRQFDVGWAGHDLPVLSLGRLQGRLRRINCRLGSGILGLRGLQGGFGLSHLDPGQGHSLLGGCDLFRASSSRQAVEVGLGDLDGCLSLCHLRLQAFRLERGQHLASLYLIVHLDADRAHPPR